MLRLPFPLHQSPPPHGKRQRMDLRFDVDASEFQERKRRRISNMNTTPAPNPKVPPTSAPAVHEIATFLPGRLEFEHELDNEAEDLVKDLEFGIVTQYGGDSIPFDDTAPPPPPAEKPDPAVSNSGPTPSSINQSQKVVNGPVNGHSALVNGNACDPKPEPADKSADDDEDAEAEENMMPPPIETDDSIAFKLTILDIYASRIEKRHESKAIMFERGLLEYKKASCLPRGPVILSNSCSTGSSGRQKATERRKRYRPPPPPFRQITIRCGLRGILC